MCDNVMSVAQARCPDCKAVLMVPYNWCPDPRFRGFYDERAAARLLVAHAREMPLLHPTILPEHHALRRPA